ncbi:MAG: cell wall-associated NlpC family hydrolase [Rhodoferax sp.]|jgi:cell wall-associated NlpC family hydrolase
MLPMMRIFLLLFILLFAVSAKASPPPSTDEMDKYLMDKSLLAKIDQVRQSVGETTSSLVFTAMGFLGVPYRRGGNSAETGFDCSGFVRAIYQQTVGLMLPRKAEQQAAATEKIERADLQPGDLVFFNTMRRAFSHVGIYVGEGKFIHSPKPGAEVRVEDMGVSYWRKRFDGARRVLTSAPGTPVPQALPVVEPALR